MAAADRGAYARARLEPGDRGVEVGSAEEQVIESVSRVAQDAGHPPGPWRLVPEAEGCPGA